MKTPNSVAATTTMFNTGNYAAASETPAMKKHRMVQSGMIKKVNKKVG